MTTEDKPIISRGLDHPIQKIKKEIEYGPYKTTVEWMPLVTEEEMSVATDIIAKISKDIDDSADFELTCVQAITFERV